MKYNIGDIVRYKDGYTEGKGEIVKYGNNEYLVEIGKHSRAYYVKTGETVSHSGTCRYYAEENLQKVCSTKSNSWNGEFPFPEKWFVRWGDAQDKDDCNKHFNKTWVFNDERHHKGAVITHKGEYIGAIRISSNFNKSEKYGTEVSMDQFRKYVMKKEEIKTSSVADRELEIDWEQFKKSVVSMPLEGMNASSGNAICNGDGTWRYSIGADPVSNDRIYKVWMERSPRNGYREYQNPNVWASGGINKPWVLFDADKYDLYGNKKEISCIEAMIPAQREYNRVINELGDKVSLDSLQRAIGEYFYGKTKGVERMPQAIIITRRKAKRRKLV